MPQCTNGSQPQASAPAFFTFTESDLATFAPPILGFVTYALMGIPTGPIQTSDFCSTEPSTDLPTAADYAKLAFPPLAFLTGSYGRFGNQVRSDKFAQLCQCTPAQGQPSSICTSTWPTNHVFTDQGGAGSNFEIGTRFTSKVAQTLTTVRIWQTNAPSSIALTLWDANGTHLFGMNVTPVGQNSATDVTLTTPQNLLANHDYVLSICLAQGFPNLADTTNTPPSDAFIGYVSHTFATGCGNFPSGASGGWGPVQPLICQPGTPYNPPPALTPPAGWVPAPAAPTCGTTQDICNNLQTITNKLLTIETMVNLIQRQKVPFGYILGTASSGLTGNGTLVVQGIIGALVTLTTIPIQWGQTSDVPARSIPKYGEISFATIDGLTEPQQIHYSSQIFLGEGFATKINYTLRPGLVATITPITREP
jgi:Domain of unknown function (DUF4082)